MNFRSTDQLPVYKDDDQLDKINLPTKKDETYSISFQLMEPYQYGTKLKVKTSDFQSLSRIAKPKMNLYARFLSFFF